jgi:hypothetical protein
MSERIEEAREQGPLIGGVVRRVTVFRVFIRLFFAEE